MLRMSRVYTTLWIYMHMISYSDLLECNVFQTCIIIAKRFLPVGFGFWCATGSSGPFTCWCSARARGSGGCHGDRDWTLLWWGGINLKPKGQIKHTAAAPIQQLWNGNTVCVCFVVSDFWVYFGSFCALVGLCVLCMAVVVVYIMCQLFW